MFAFDDHREVSLGLDDLLATGLVADGASLDFDQFEFSAGLDAGGLVRGVRIDITAARASIEAAFDIDLSPMPNETIEFSWEYEYSTQIDSSYFENF